MSVGRPRAARIALAALAAALGALALKCAWVCDDAYISFRVLDNFVHGYGLRWNASERVQAFTHPLWLALMAPFYALTREAYLTSIALGIATTLAAAAVLALRASKDAGGAALALVWLAGSKAFVDYATSGLENPLAHLLFALAVVELARERPRAARASLWTALLALTRPDAVLALAPALAAHLWRARGWSTARAALAGLAPLLAWAAFSFLYYGSLVPNTAVAKLSTGLPAGELAAQGGRYLAHALTHDPLTPAAIAAGCALAAWRGAALERALALGLALHLAYVVSIGGDFMSGRFLTLPLFGAALIAARAPLGSRLRLGLASAALALALATPLSPLRAPLEYGRGLEKAAHIDASGIADERGYWFENAGLFSALRGDASHPDVSKGVRFAARLREEGTRVAIAGTPGYIGYWCGPSVHLVDPLGLADAFLARLPIVRDGALVAPEKNRFRDRAWRIGHFVREVPEGYVESRVDPAVTLADPELEALRRRVDRVVRDPLLARERLRTLFGR